MINKKINTSFTLLLFLILFFGACTQKQSTLIKGDFTTAIVERGLVENYELTEGVVQPANEVLLLSPSSSIIQQIVKKSGQKVKQGDVIVRLNTADIKNKIDHITDQIEVKQNNLEKTLLNARSTRADLAYNVEVKKLKIASIKSMLADQEQLLEVGGISQAKFEKSKQELVLAEKDLQLAKQKNAIKLQQLKAEEKGLLLQIEMQEKDKANQIALLERMTVKAPSDGIILNIHGKEGEKIQGDKLLVSMSDLTRFEIRASIDDKFKRLIKTGRRAYVMIDKDRLEGRIGIVRPTLEDGKVVFTVGLTESKHSSLAPNLRVGLQIVKRSRKDVLRIANGPAFNKQNQQYTFVIDKDSAIREKILVGLVTDEYIELKEGIEEGSELVTSDINGIKHLQAVKIQLP